MSTELRYEQFVFDFFDNFDFKKIHPKVKKLLQASLSE